jgi:DNA polymerase III epsilon subunit-like protein
VEVALVAPDGSVLLETLVHPGVPIPPQVTDVHGIADADVADAPTWREVAPLLLRAAAELDTVVAFCDSFERRVLAHQGAELDVAWWDAQQAAVDAGMRAGANGWLSLASACRQAQVAWVPTHRAADDCRATVELVHRLGSAQPVLEKELDPPGNALLPR